MNPIDRPGTYRGHPTEVAVNTTKNGFPQLVIRLAADDLYDGETSEWTPWSEYGQDIIGYFALFGAKGKCLNFEQVQKALGWDGASFANLDQLEDLEARTCQFRVKWDKYNGTTALKVSWIDAADATPGGAGLRKVDTTVLTALDAQYAGQLVRKKITPKKAPTSKPVLPSAAKPTLTAEKPVAETTPETVEESKPADAPPPPRATRGKKTGGGLPTSCSHEGAWGKVCELKMASVTDDQLSAAWLKAVDTVAGEDVDVEDVTQDQWATIRDQVLDVIPSMPF